MIFTECDTRKMDEYVDGDFYSVSTPPSSKDNIRQELYDIIESRLKLAAMGIDTHNEQILSVIGIDVHDGYVASKILRNMYNQINDIEKLVDDIIQQDITRDAFTNELNVIDSQVVDGVVDEVIRDAIANGMISTNEQTEQQRSGKQPVTTVKPVKTKKFKIGEHYLIHPMNNKKLRREFVVKKTIYSIKDREVNIVIMKQISGPESTTKFTLSKEDCLKFHLKYEDGLQVYSMELDWKLLKNKK